jgi:hypothetical protein
MMATKAFIPRNWKPARDVYGAFVYQEISPDVRCARRGDMSAYRYEVQQYTELAEQWTPVRSDGPMHNADVAIAAAKRRARAIGQEPIGVR